MYPEADMTRSAPASIAATPVTAVPHPTCRNSADVNASQAPQASQSQQQQQQQQQHIPANPSFPPDPEHIATARAALVASLSNLVDSELMSRAGVLHSNAAAIDKQERDVLKATEALRRENVKLAREADGAARKVKELGNVQNWAEVTERGFLVLEETVRMANRGRSGMESGSESGSGSCSCSCSECGGGDDGDGAEDGRAASLEGGQRMDVDGDEVLAVEQNGTGKGKERMIETCNEVEMSSDTTGEQGMSS